MTPPCPKLRADDGRCRATGCACCASVLEVKVDRLTRELEGWYLDYYTGQMAFDQYIDKVLSGGGAP